MSTLKVNNIQPFSGTTITANELIATGSFSGSFTGTLDGSVTSASFATTASYVQADNIDQPFTNVTASNYVTAVNVSASSGLYGNSLFLGPTARIQHTNGGSILLLNALDGTNANISSSFSGSFQGDGSGLTGVIAAAFPFTGSAKITGSLEVTGPETSIVNGVKIVEVESEADFPTPVGTQINLESDTTYIIKGTVDVNNTIFASGSGIGIHGVDNTRDTLRYTNSASMLTVENSDFSMQNLRLSATHTSSLLISGSDYTSGRFNQGILKIFESYNFKFRNCCNVASLKGDDLIDLNNVIFTYIQAPDNGLKFQDTSKVEISSCEFIRWYDETSNPTPSGYATCPMIEFDTNGAEDAGFGAVDITSCIIHPQVQQDGIFISTGSTTNFGVISSNTFVNNNLTTGSLIAGSSYDSASAVSYDIEVNQGVEDSVAYLYGYQSGTDVQSASTTYTQVTIANFQTNIETRMSASLEGVVYIGTKPIDVLFQINAGIAGITSNNEQFDIALYKNSALILGSERRLELDAGEEGNVVTFALTNIVENDLLTVYQKSPTNDDFTLQNFSIMIKE